jgi:hypothetical protein
MLISFDVGIKNLAYCIIDYTDSIIKIIDWQVVSIEGTDIYQHSRSLFDILKNICSEHGRLDTVLIENQPCNKNPKMKSIQMMIFSFFVLQDMTVHMISAVNKLKVKKNPVPSEKLTYAQKKKRGVELALMYIDDAALTDKLTSSKKKDDLADCYLQGVFWLEKNDLVCN